LLKTVPLSYITKVEKNAPYRLHEAISTLIRIYAATAIGTEPAFVFTPSQAVREMIAELTFR